jgi:hypothetical protein
MFKLIGIVVFVGVVFLGWPSFQKWYYGEATPQETVEQVRNKVGNALITNQLQGSESNPNVANQKPIAQTNSQVKVSPSEDKPLTAEQLLRSMNK